MISSLQITNEEKDRRRQLTNFAVKMMLVAVGIAFLVQVVYYLLMLFLGRSSLNWEFALQFSISITAMGLFVLLLGLNYYKVVPYWVSSTLFLVALSFAALVSDTPGEVINGRSTMFFMVPILLSGVLIHSYATFASTSLVVLLLGIYSLLTQGMFVNSPNIIFLYLFAGLVSLVLRSLERSTEQLRRQAAENNTVLSSLRGSYILTDKNFRILQLNEKTLSILPSAAPGVNLVQVLQDVSIEVSDADRKNLFDVVTGVDTRDVQVKIADQYYYAANIYIPTNNEHLVFLRNITAEVEIDRLKDTALAMVSHELRTPLTAIQGQAELAIQKPYTAVSNAARILLNTQRLLIMVDNLLSQSRLRTGKVKNTPSPTNIETVFRVVHSLLASEAKDQRLEFRMNLDMDIPIVMVDAVLLQQILTNLASNAIKFTHEGSVSMTALMPDAGHWMISVCDTGPGIQASKRVEIFKEFFQAEADTVYDRPHQGTGLGLSIVQGLVEQMGGKLALQSEVGLGSTFSVVFPLVLPKEITRKRK